MRRIVVAAVALAFLAGCPPRERAATPAGTPALASPREGGTLYRRLDVEISTLNPVLSTSREDRLVANCLFTPLVRIDASLKPIPGLAKSWKISPDGTLYTFELEKKATFSDGTPVRASDVLFTLKKVADPATEAVQIASYFELLDLARTRVIDDHTIEIAFREALAAQLGQFNNLLVLPEHVYGKGDFAAGFTARAVGSGPYTLVRRVPGKEVVLRRREDYWDKKPYITSVVFRVVSNTTTAWNAVKIGELDETNIASDLWARARNDASVRAKLDLRRFYMRSYNFIAWNGRDPLFADKRVRRAMAMCVNLPVIINELYGGTARALNGPFMPDEPSFNAEVPVVAFDPAGAKQMLVSDGWLDTNGDSILDRKGVPLAFDFMVMSGSSSAMTFAQLLQSELKAIGVSMEIVVVDGAVAIQRFLDGDYQAGYLSWEADPDPDVYQILHSSQVPPQGQNFVFYSNPEADRLIEAGRREIDPAKRIAIYRQLHTVLAADQPYTWTVQPSLKWAINKRVQGVRESHGLGLFTWYPGEFDWWIAE